MTAYYLRISDWSSDVCSSDLTVARRLLDEIPPALRAEAWLERIEQYVTALAPEDRAALRDGVHGGLKVVTASALPDAARSEEHTSELQSLMRISYAVFCLKKKKKTKTIAKKNITIILDNHRCMRHNILR